MEIREDMASRPRPGTKFEANRWPVSGVIKIGEEIKKIEILYCMQGYGQSKVLEVK
jgi:hypothetical protein